MNTPSKMDHGWDGTPSRTRYDRLARARPAWENIHQNSLNALEPVVESLAGTWSWNNVIEPLFSQPTGCARPRHRLLVLLGQKKKPVIGYVRD
jgi:hypothetical protein